MHLPSTLTDLSIYTTWLINTQLAYTAEEFSILFTREFLYKYFITQSERGSVYLLIFLCQLMESFFLWFCICYSLSAYHSIPHYHPMDTYQFFYIFFFFYTNKEGTQPPWQPLQLKLKENIITLFIIYHSSQSPPTLSVFRFCVIYQIPKF